MKRIGLTLAAISIFSTIAICQVLNLSVSGNDVTCFGYSDGSAMVSVFNGTSPYTYSWSNGCTTFQNMNLAAGQYSVTVEDFNGLTGYATITLDQPEAIFVSPAWGGLICIGESFSTIVHATGGTIGFSSGYDYTWIGSDGVDYYGNNLNVSPVITTNYQLVVTDDNNCFGEMQEITVTVNPEISAHLLGEDTIVICDGDQVNLDLEIMGGNGGPYTINLDGYGIINTPLTFFPDESGFYTFTVADDCGSPNGKDSVFITVNIGPIQYATQQEPEDGILSAGEYGTISITQSESGTVYYVVKNEQVVTNEFEGNGSSIVLGTNFLVGTYLIKSRKLSCGCERTQGYANFTNENSVSINVNSAVKLFPNPASDFVFVENAPISATYQITTQNGIIAGCGAVQNNRIDLSPYDGGVYLVTIVCGNDKIYVEKIIVK